MAYYGSFYYVLCRQMTAGFPESREGEFEWRDREHDSFELHKIINKTSKNMVKEE